MVSVGAWLVIVGVVVFFAGAAYGVPQVFGVHSAEDRLAVLLPRARAWRSAQWLYAVGPILASLGVLVVAIGWPGQSQLLAGVAGAAMVAGAVLWSVSCARRGASIEEFARGELPAGAWLGYVWLTLLGLAVLGVACIGVSTWLAVVLLVSAVAFCVLFLVTRDIPPFLFYLVLAVVGGWLLASPR